MKAIILFLILFTYSFTAFSIEYKGRCIIEACRDIQKPVNAASWCDGYDESVAVLSMDPNYITPDSPPSGPNVSIVSDGDQVEYYMFNQNIEHNGRSVKTDVFVDGYWWDRYYERYHLYMNCNR